MSTQLKLRRGTTAQHSTFTGASGEITVDTSKKTLVVHDGSTAGGVPLAVDSTVVHTTGNETVGGTKTFSANPIINAGTANGVAYLNGSKVLTTGSDLNWDGSKLGIGRTAASLRVEVGGNIGVNTSTPPGGNGSGISIYASDFPRLTLRNATTGDTSLDGLQIYMVGNDVSYDLTESGYQRWMTGGSEQMRLTSTGLGIGTSSPGYKLDVVGAIRSSNSGNENYFVSDGSTQSSLQQNSNSLFYNANVNSATNGQFVWRSSNAYTERMRLDASGNLGIGTTSPTRKLSVGGTSNAYMDFNASSFRRYTIGSEGNGFIVFDDAAGAYRLTIDASGNLVGGGTTSVIYWTGVYNNTTASAANMFVASNGSFARSTSSLKYKTDVQDAVHGLADVLKLRPVTYKGKSASDGDTVFGGLIAEEVHEAGLTEFVQYAEDGSPDALAYGNMVSLCVKAIQEQQAMIQQLQAEVAALKAQ